jgi:hypothetical protein
MASSISARQSNPLPATISDRHHGHKRSRGSHPDRRPATTLGVAPSQADDDDHLVALWGTDASSGGLGSCQAEVRSFRAFEASRCGRCGWATRTPPSTARPTWRRACPTDVVKSLLSSRPLLPFNPGAALRMPTPGDPVGSRPRLRAASDTFTLESSARSGRQRTELGTVDAAAPSRQACTATNLAERFPSLSVMPPVLVKPTSGCAVSRPA